MTGNILTTQLKATCRITKARWAAWLAPVPEGWAFGVKHGLTKARLATLESFIEQPKTTQWMAGALSSGRMRSQATRTLAKSLECERVYLFPNAKNQAVLLVGADELEKMARDFFKVLCLQPGNGILKEGVDFSLPERISLEIGSEAAYDFPRALERILEDVVNNQPCDAACLAIRQGEFFRIEAGWKCKPQLIGFQIPTGADTLAGQIAASRRGQVVVDPAAITGLAPPSGFKSAIKSWMGVPLVIGQRVIGLAAFVVFRPKGFTSGDLRRAHELARYIAPVVENAVAFAEAERHLQRQALLNELASAASVSTDVESVARRVLRMLRRTFHTNRAGLLLLAADGETLQAYGADKRRKMPPLDSALSGHVIRSGMPVRVGEAGETPVENLPEHVRSALAVPLKYRGNIIGVLGLESDTPNAFSQQDEQLIMVITSHLAGLIENIHLNEETRERAHNLSAIHQVVQQIVGLVDVSEIAQVAADLTAERFGYDLVLVLLMSETSETLAVQGVGGADAHPVKIGAQFSVHEELVGDVLRTGASALIQNTDTLVCLPIPGRGAGSQMCVPLREGDQIFGVVAVDRLPKGGVNENDLLVLESLAGVLSSVLMNARRYNQLQERIEAQKLAEKRLVQSARLAAVGEMAASVAHELNNPLTTIAGFTELVLDDMGEDSIQREDLELVLREARRARGVVRRLLDFSRQGDHMKSPVDINEILGEVLALVHHLARATGVEVRFVPWDDLPVIRMDRGQMKQVVLNLVHNALQAMPHGGALVLQTTSEQREDKNWIALQVLDTGEGIPDDIINRIFEPFFTTKPVGSGTGLGLSISYNIVSDHGGFMEVESQAGKGSCFTIWLPAENGAQSHGRDDAQ